ncbi:hypothetical protein [Acidicapsa acidisoli]|uniref:hypothetical protein n=1 Tax=Acidicapsa acidisoli TaxID=1615681 RepID=UPI0021E00E09|nr:hypothetical protein [Acidicapsa acidisoli]
MTIGELIAAVEHAMDKGAYACLCEGEARKGYVAVTPGSVPWLPSGDWPDDIVITQKGREVRIVAIYAKEPCNGAFSRMINGILKAGLRPVVVEPMGGMNDIMRAWNWRCREVGSTFDDHERHWFPQRKWIEHRTKGPAVMMSVKDARRFHRRNKTQPSGQGRPPLLQP